MWVQDEGEVRQTAGAVAKAGRCQRVAGRGLEGSDSVPGLGPALVSAPWGAVCGSLDIWT